MSIVTVIINNKNFQLACGDGEEEQLHNLAAQVNAKIAEIKKASPLASNELLLIMTALSLQEQLQNSLPNSNKLVTEKANNAEEKLAETLTTIAGYLETLAQKIEK